MSLYLHLKAIKQATRHKYKSIWWDLQIKQEQMYETTEDN